MADEEYDLIDRELYALVDKLAPTEDALEGALDLILGVIEDLADEGKIEDIPEEGSSEEEQRAWVNNSLPLVKQAINSSVGGTAIPEN